MAVKFSDGVHYVLDDSEPYGAFVSEVKFVQKGDNKEYEMYEIKFEVFDPRDVLCKEGKRDKTTGKVIDTCVGKGVKSTLWLTDGAISNTAKNMIQVLAESKGLDIEDFAFNLTDLKGAVCRIGIVNVADKKDKTKLYSNVDLKQVWKASDDLKKLCRMYLDAKAQKNAKTESAITGEAKPAPEPKPEPQPEPVKKVDETTDGKNPFLS